jgi:hypothetical protein
MGKYSDIGSYVIGDVTSAANGALVLSSDEMNARNVANSVFLEWTGAAIRPLSPKRIHTKYLSFIQATGELIAVGEYGRGVVFVDGRARDDSVTTSGSDPENRGPLRGGVTIDADVIVVGLHRQVYRRVAGAWSTMEDGLPPVPKGTVAGYEAVTAFSSKEIYAAGWDGEMAAYDGATWRQIDSPTNLLMVAMCAAGDGQVYACGRRGLLVRGRGDEWEVVDHQSTVDDLWSVRWFQGALYASSMRTVYRFENGKFVPTDASSTGATTFYSLSSCPDVLWSVGPKDVVAFDGVQWQRID